jgi:hypothetical protein
MWKQKPSHCACPKCHLSDAELRHWSRWIVHRSWKQCGCRFGCHLYSQEPSRSTLYLPDVPWTGGSQRKLACELDARLDEHSTGCSSTVVQACGPAHGLLDG